MLDAKQLARLEFLVDEALFRVADQFKIRDVQTLLEVVEVKNYFRDRGYTVIAEARFIDQEKKSTETSQVIYDLIISKKKS